jgi:hypothetical protein
MWDRAADFGDLRKDPVALNIATDELLLCEQSSTMVVASVAI